MAGSFKKIDYRLRPAKHAERVMLVDLFKRFRFAPIESYQYVGFGSVAFVDFRMVHRALGIEKLISIEGTADQDEQTRFNHNIPYAGLTLHFGHSSEVLPALDFEQRSLVWLDYDDTLARSMANDLSTVARAVPSGSFLAVTFTTSFPTVQKDREAELGRLREEFPDFLAEDVKASAFDGGKYAEFGRFVLGSLLEKAVSDADAGIVDELNRRQVRQLCYFRYRDGAGMATVGWLIINGADAQAFEACKFDALPFVRSGDQPFKITIPLVTPVEIREMERRLPNLAAAHDISWIPQRDRESFREVYRYLPHFAPIET